jgi:tetratricopeptide (TPR) repeat protein
LADQQGDLQGAESCYRKCLQGREKSLGNKHPETLEVASNLALTLSKTDLNDEAADLFARAMSGFEEICGPDDSRALECAARLGAMRLRQDRRSEAFELFEKVYEGRRRTLGEKHEITLNDLAIFATLLDKRARTRERAIGDGERVEEMYARVLDASKKAPDVRSRMMLKAIVRLGFLRKRIGDFEGAEDAYSHALGKLVKSLGPIDQETLQTAVNLAVLYKEMGRAKDEKAVYERFISSANDAMTDLSAEESKFIDAMKTRLLKLELEDLPMETQRD